MLILGKKELKVVKLKGLNNYCNSKIFFVCEKNFLDYKDPQY